MVLFRELLNRAFPLMAITGLLLAGWGLIITPDEMRSDSQWGKQTFKESPAAALASAMEMP